MDESSQNEKTGLPFDINKLFNTQPKPTTSTPPRYLSKSSALDEITNNEQMHIIKAALPYLDLKMQKQMALLVKFLEFKNTINIYQKDDANLLQSLSLSKEPKENMLHSIRSVCSEGNQSLIDILLNLLNINKLYKNYQLFQAKQSKSAVSNNVAEASKEEEPLPSVAISPADEANQEDPSKEATTPSKTQNNTSSMIDQLKGMLTPEQKTMFDMFSTMMQSNQNNQKGE